MKKIMEGYKIGDILPVWILPPLIENGFMMVINGSSFDIYGLLYGIRSDDAEAFTKEPITISLYIQDEIPFIIGAYGNALFDTYLNVYRIDKYVAKTWLSDLNSTEVNMYLIERTGVVLAATRTIQIHFMEQLKRASVMQLKSYPDAASVNEKAFDLLKRYGAVNMRTDAVMTETFL